MRVLLVVRFWLLLTRETRSKGIGAGLQTDNTVYDIVYDREMTMLDLMQKDVKKPQRVIKAIGRAGSIDGFGTVVIGEDFIITSSSKFDYFVLYYYKRIR